MRTSVFFIKLYFIHCMVSCGKKTHGYFCISIDTKYTDEKCGRGEIVRERWCLKGAESVV